MEPWRKELEEREGKARHDIMRDTASRSRSNESTTWIPSIWGRSAFGLL